ncbi:FadR family transcriptional regulator [Sporolactobacillus sp. THM7-7]|nr:FadR family transcriptional regulator [Sporolactobacillus sp. THM7-7]
MKGIVLFMNNLLYAKIISDIDKKINQGLLLPNQKLPSERQMSQQYNVSRTVVREAIKVLSEKGLVEIRVGKGTYITRPNNRNVTNTMKRVIRSSNATIEDIIEVREELELSTVKKAVINATEQGIEKLKKTCAEMDKKDIKVGEFVEKDAKFHLCLARLTGNNIFYLLIHSFYDMTDKALFEITHMVPADIEEAQVQHWGIVNAVEKKDLTLAKRIVKAHINLIREEVRLLKGKKVL